MRGSARPTVAPGRVREILRTVREVEDMARAVRDRLAGRIRIGVIPTIAPYLLPRIVGDMTARHPGLDLQLRETVTPRLLSELSEGTLDTAIVALPVSEPAFEEVPLFTEDLVLVRPGADADRPVPSPERLREMRLLLLEEGHCFRDQALSFCNMTDKNVKIFADFVRTQLSEGTVQFKRQYLRAVIDKIIVNDEEVKTFLYHSGIETAAIAFTAGSPRRTVVPSSVRHWRRRCPPSIFPPRSEAGSRCIEFFGR